MTIRSHTVSKTYLRRFVNQKERLRAFDRVRQHAMTMPIKDAIVVRRIYEVPTAEGIDTQAIENFLPSRARRTATSERRSLSTARPQGHLLARRRLGLACSDFV